MGWVINYCFSNRAYCFLPINAFSKAITKKGVNCLYHIFYKEKSDDTVSLILLKFKRLLKQTADYASYICYFIKIFYQFCSNYDLNNVERIQCESKSYKDPISADKKALPAIFNLTCSKLEYEFSTLLKLLI